jgi:sulfur transfer protein SufE
VKPTIPPDWFTTAIRTGLAQVYAMSLQGCPSSEIIKATTATWIDDLWHDSRFAWADPPKDATRIAEAFRTLRRTSERWPTMPEFVRALPAPPERVSLAHKPCSDEQAAANVDRLKRLAGELLH